jgi:O-methyltransferase
MLKNLVRLALDRAGYEIARKQPALPPAFHNGDDECDRMIRMVRPHTMVAQEGLVTLYSQALFCETHQIPGDFVECGVWKGGAVGLMALVNLSHSSARRHIHLFDSFQEICEPDERVDGERALREVKRWSKTAGTKGHLAPLEGFYDHRGGPGSIEETRALLEGKIGYDANYLHWHPGWFQHVLPAEHHDIERIALLRIDADWYASTKICLEYLFDKVVSGGFVIIDDYGAYEGCRKAVDEFAGGYGKPLYLNSVNSEIRYIVVP